MATHPLFGDVPDVNVDPVSAATALGDIISILRGGDVGSNPISQGIGAQTATMTPQSASQDATQPSAPPPADGATHASPVPEGTGVSQPFGGNHPGIDLSVPLNTQLLAAASGKVTVASNADPGGYGLYVEIQTPDGFTLRYGHLHSSTVQVGDEVRAGQVIGFSGGEAGGATSGNSTGPHLHFEVDVNGTPVDPTPFLAGGYTIVGGQAAPGSSTSLTPISADPKAIGAIQIQNVLNVLGGKPAQDLTTTPAAATPNGEKTPVVEGDMDSYFSAVLNRLGLPVTDANLRFMRAWQKAEGGDTTNPFNTTQDAPGATEFNSVGVKRYPDMATGVDATVRTLSNGLYENILAALRAGTDPMAAATALANSPWGTGALVKQILGGA